MRVAPKIGTEIFIASPIVEEDCRGYIWEGDALDIYRLNSGLLHLVGESADVHAKALLSFTTIV